MSTELDGDGVPMLVNVTFSSKGQDHSLSIPVVSKKDGTISSSLTALRERMADSRIPQEMENAVRDLVSRAAAKAHVHVNDDLTMRPLPAEERAANIRDWSNAYRRHTVMYSEQAEAYNGLVNSSSTTLFDTLLQLERSYAQVVEDAWAQSEQKLAELQSKHAMEMDMAVKEGMAGQPSFANLVAQQLEEMEMLQATTESQMQEIYESQRTEYRDFVIKVHDEMVFRAGQTPPSVESESGTPHRAGSALSVFDLTSTSHRQAKAKAEKGTKVVSAAIKKLERMPSTEVLHMDNSSRSSKWDAARKLPAEAPDPELLKLTREIEEMGFTADQAKAALELTKNHMEQAVVMLLENPERITDYIQSRVASPKRVATLAEPVRIASTGSISRQGSNLWAPRFPQGQPPIAGSPAQSGSATPIESPMPGKRAFSPLAFIQQQQVKLANHGSAPLKKMSSLFGKALGIDEHESSVRNSMYNGLDGELSELFTIYFGTQRCKRSTEFHFDDLDTQLQKVKDAYKRNDTAIKSEITTQSPIMAGYRNILKAAHRCDVHNLTIPLLLLPDDANEPMSPSSNALSGMSTPTSNTGSTNRALMANLSEAAIQRRAELVLKGTKGMIMGQSRASKHSGDSSGRMADDGDLKCDLLDDFAIIVQVLLGALALGSLAFKRHRESPKRPVLIWVMDTSKQALGSALVHFSNVVAAYFSGNNGNDVRNPCIWYFLNIALDTTAGVGLLYVFLRGLHAIAEHLNVKDIETGNYGQPPRFQPWLRQFLLYLTGWFFVKLVVVLSLETFPIFSLAAEWILGPITRTRDPRLQVLVVMLLFPLCMNIVQAWLIDTFIKGKRYGASKRYMAVEEGPDDEEGDEGERGFIRDEVDGRGGRETIASRLTAILRKDIQKIADVVYLDAPHIIPPTDDELDPFSASYDPDRAKEESRSWWTDAEDERTLKPSFDAVRECWAREGPFDGILGFSQGAAFTALLATELRREKSSYLEEGRANVVRPPKFVILVGGFVTTKEGGPAGSWLAEKVTGIASMHVIGRSDNIIAPKRSFLLAERFENPKIVEHEGG
ncbi:hypothetical protein HK101_011886 [Irineochytrium annulatum]|nr:hypothetical protein HK101_011886 [Irineochytrium annulatum]